MARAPIAMLILAGCTPAGLDDLAIQPAEPTTDDDLVAGPVPAGRTTWTWSVDGVEVADLVGNVVPAARTTRGEVWTLRVTGGMHDGEASVEIADAPPVASVRIAPDPPLAGQDLTAVAEAVDPDGDPVDLGFSWTVDGAPGPTGATVPGVLVRGGQRWAVEVVVSDGANEQVVGAEVVVGNTSPRITSAILSPSDPTSSSTLSVLWDAVDYDGDEVTATVRWEVNGIEVSTAPELPSYGFERDDLVRAIVTPSDGKVEGLPVGSDVVLIENGAPTATAAWIDPQQLTEAVVAECALQLPSDPDADRVDVSVQWIVNGNLASTLPALTGVSFDEGDYVQCVATPTDGLDEGATLASTVVQVGNAEPVLGTVRLVPEVPTAAGPVTAVLDGAYDPDEDDVIETLTTWRVNGYVVSTGDQLDGLHRDDWVQAEVSGWDGQDAALPVYSLEVQVANALPEVASLALTPAAPTDGDAVTAGFVLTDADGDTVSASVEWFEDGAPLYTGNPLPAGTVSAGSVLGWQVTAADGIDEIVVVGPAVTVAQ